MDQEAIESDRNSIFLFWNSPWVECVALAVKGRMFIYFTQGLFSVEKLSLTSHIGKGEEEVGI